MSHACAGLAGWLALPDGVEWKRLTPMPARMRVPSGLRRECFGQSMSASLHTSPQQGVQGCHRRPIFPVSHRAKGENTTRLGTLP
jgi:hypothetical protein